MPQSLWLLAHPLHPAWGWHELCCSEQCWPCIPRRVSPPASVAGGSHRHGKWWYMRKLSEQAPCFGLSPEGKHPGSGFLRLHHQMVYAFSHCIPGVLQCWFMVTGSSTSLTTKAAASVCICNLFIFSSLECHLKTLSIFIILLACSQLFWQITFHT